MSDDQTAVSDLLEDNQYKYGFTTDVESETFAKGLNEEVVRAISKKKKEPEFMLNFRLKAFEKWKTMKEPAWPNVNYPPIDFQDISYYSAPKKKKQLQSLDEVDPEVMRTFEKLGIPLDEQKKLANVAVDAVFDSVSVATTHKKKLMEREQHIAICMSHGVFTVSKLSKCHTQKGWEGGAPNTDTHKAQMELG